MSLRNKIADLFTLVFASNHAEERALIDLYCQDAETLGLHVFDMSDQECHMFVCWLRKHLTENVGEPFNMHEMPFFECCAWKDIYRGDDPRLEEYTQKYIKAKKKGLKLNF